MTEEEAKSKACCGTDMVYCVASACMAWRLIEVKSQDTPNLTTLTGHKPGGVMGGYCGLAGKP
jgi:hypothetical protein